MSKPTIVEFDLDRYLRNSKKVDLSGISWDEVRKHPLTDGDVMCIHYMMDIETHTVIYLRDLLATRVAADPQITAFLSCWVYEELWHGEAFSDFLRSYGIEVPAEPKLPGGSTPMPTRPNRWRDLRVRIGVGNGLWVGPTRRSTPSVSTSSAPARRAASRSARSTALSPRSRASRA